MKYLSIVLRLLFLNIQLRPHILHMMTHLLPPLNYQCFQMDYKDQILLLYALNYYFSTVLKFTFSPVSKCHQYQLFSGFRVGLLLLKVVIVVRLEYCCWVYDDQFQISSYSMSINNHQFPQVHHLHPLLRLLHPLLPPHLHHFSSPLLDLMIQID